MKWNVTIFNMTFPKEREVVTVEAETQDAAERYAISGGLVNLQSGWGVWDSEPADYLPINKPKDAETIDVILSPDRFPIAYEKKLEELTEEGAFDSEEEAKKWLSETPITLELIYEKGCGLFAVESYALDAAEESICSPYSKKPFIVL